MSIKIEIKKGSYRDSVSLMQTAKMLQAFPGIKDCAVVMGTAENKAILKNAGLFTDACAGACDNDLLIAVKAADSTAVIAALKKADELLSSKPAQNTAGNSGLIVCKSLSGAGSELNGANLVLISVAGRFAGKLAADALDLGQNVMLFSDNVSLQTELELKNSAFKKNLLVMGPDCGTAIINGVPLAFANAVNRGNIGIIAASGTGLQEVSTIISNEGAGISQAIGTGSRDIKKDIGAISFLQGLRMLGEDPATKIIVLISKPPHPTVLKKILAKVRQINKPVVAVMLGALPGLKAKKDFYTAKTLEEAALKAACLARDGNMKNSAAKIFNINQEIEKIAVAPSAVRGSSRKYLRGLYSGGTFVGEAQIVLNSMNFGTVFSNAPLSEKYRLKDTLALKGHSVIDLGEDEFTVGRPHPMIDFSLRNRLILEQAKNPETAVILLDLVLGYGANMQPLEDILPVIQKAFKAGVPFIVASVTGTENDPQVRSKVVAGLQAAGVQVMPSNAAATRLAARLIINACCKRL